jgi:UDP-N-acetylmuramoyl-L-alanyl-D-glutamate--2,6-diaminopimelate ligase
MMLKEILNGCDYTGSMQNRGTAMETDISGIAYDSRNVRDGYLFVAIKGETVDGHDFIKAAIEKGAVAVVHEHGIGDSVMQDPDMHSAPCFISVRDSKRALACISNNFYQRPSENLTLIGITGTNGKTTTTYILKSILESWGRHIGLIGTIQYMIKDRVYPALHTTPESPEFQSLLSTMYISGCTHVISEVSSHALAQYRVDKAVFNTAVFTNLTRDHLDFHQSMENYFRAKERLFAELLDQNGASVINSDDPYGRRLISEMRASNSEVNILTYGLEIGADIIAADIDNSFEGLRFKILFKGKRCDIVSPLMGIPNVYNILSAAGAAISIGVPWDVISEGISKTGRIAGRFEKVNEGQAFLCIIDYAHTEDALERLISTAREIVSIPHPPIVGSSPRVITVFGCGGDRDRGKRPGMGEIAARLSDFVIITSDNPRSEEPLNIIKDIEDGATRNNYLIEPDRKTAIRKAVEMADDGDIVLIAGKGHEDYQEIHGVRYPFSDRVVLKECINNRLKMKNAE